MEKWKSIPVDTYGVDTPRTDRNRFDDATTDPEILDSRIEQFDPSHPVDRDLLASLRSDKLIAFLFGIEWFDKKLLATTTKDKDYLLSNIDRLLGVAIPDKLSIIDREDIPKQEATRAMRRGATAKDYWEKVHTMDTLYLPWLEDLQDLVERDINALCSLDAILDCLTTIYAPELT